MRSQDTTHLFQKDSIQTVQPEKPLLKYTSFVFPKKKKDSAMALFEERYSSEERYAILALNRLDSKNKWRADTLMIPDQIDSTLMAYSPFPANLKKLQKVHKIVFFLIPFKLMLYMKKEN